MQHIAIERTILEVSQPLTKASAHLSRNSSKIRSTWTKALERYTGCGLHAALLSGLHLAARIRELRSVNPRAYREGAERQGLELASRGVPAECVIVAVAAYAESCLPYLLSDETRKAVWIRALARWVSVYQFSMLCGYASFATVERKALEDKSTLAEKRSQDFSVELGDAYEKERRRLAQDLHDEIGHDLIVLKLYTEVIALDLKKGDLGQVRRKLRRSVSLIKHARKGVRHLTFDLGPAVWSVQGFIPAVRLYTRQFAARTGLKVRFSALRLKAALPARYETALYKVLQGALANVAAHAEATHVKITLASRKNYAVMKVEDDGKGFDVQRKLSAPAHSYGLRAMRDRIELLGGTIGYASRPARRGISNHGTAIECQLPLQESETA